ncbi:PREDICTED: probably inactive leucine-rich repeat receptor-like protein kinase At5g48380 [Camelina sativa]|uniref:Probably inactive leucine-rich repeat receptor-like protein kinase At5g48380 n=1 Tax=Camelina sativa TaxID=90675 RepID=A0ABM0X815_CAMSA|nr:PREDICTED: probably inactive leucine-rich repeat receptor-like protein kinase At5g48380 [Camelina sativa]
MMVCRVFAIFFGNCLCLLLLLSSLADANQANIDCLKTFKSQVEDPNGYLSTWDFGNQTAQGFICKFAGVTCWHDDENRVFSIKISGFGLRGVFPQGFKLCSDLTGLDLSRNNFSGPLPSNISFLQLQHNQFTGTLPPQLAQLRRLKTFSVADNRLEGPIPKFNSAIITSESFANNLNLCGKPLDNCKMTSTNSHSKVVILAALGGFTVTAFVVGIVLGFFCSTISVEQLLFRKSRQNR